MGVKQLSITLDLNFPNVKKIQSDKEHIDQPPNGIRKETSQDLQQSKHKEYSTQWKDIKTYNQKRLRTT